MSKLAVLIILLVVAITVIALLIYCYKIAIYTNAVMWVYIEERCNIRTSEDQEAFKKELKEQVKMAMVKRK